MFEKFLSSYDILRKSHNEIDKDILKGISIYAHGFTELMTQCAGSTFGGGIYRLHSVQDIIKWTQIVEDSFLTYKNRLVCFGFDWLGRHFALDKGRIENNQMLILLIEPGTGEAFEIPANFKNFHNNELVDYQNDALSYNFYNEWLESTGLIPDHQQCIGYKIPLFLGGNDTIENLELIDMDVYWSICGQTLNQI